MPSGQIPQIVCPVHGDYVDYGASQWSEISANWAYPEKTGHARHFSICPVQSFVELIGMEIEHMTPVTFSSISTCALFCLTHRSYPRKWKGWTVQESYRGFAA